MDCMLSISPCIRFVLFLFYRLVPGVYLHSININTVPTVPILSGIFFFFCFSFLLSFQPCFCFYDCSHWSFVLINAPLRFSCPVNHVPDWQPRVYFKGLLSIHHTHPPYHIRVNSCQNVYWAWLTPDRSVCTTQTHTISITDPPLGGSLRVA